jgi:biofilm PGA synthesis N-glycosyltransferase PgaC
LNSGPLVTLLFAFLGLYPIVTGALWIGGGLLYRLLDEPTQAEPPPGGWPGVTVLIPAYNEENVIATCVHAARAVDYPELEVLVLDDGSTDDTVAAATGAAAGHARIEVVHDPVNRGKADRLNLGFERARHDLVVVTDSDTHLHPLAVKLLVSRISRSRRIAAVAGAPHVTNRQNLLCAMQMIEVATIIGLIRRTQALAGRVGVVAGVLGLFRRDAVLGVGGYRAEMATEDIELSWRLLLAGWHTSYEPDALVGMEVPSTVRALWAQRRRWARGQGEVLHVHLRVLMRWRHRRLWPLGLEGIASLAWVVLLAVVYAVVVATFLLTGVDVPSIEALTVLFAWGIAVCVVAALQLTFALGIDFPYDRLAALGFLLGPLYPVAYWMITAAAARRAETPALLRGPAERRVVWDIPRDQLPSG